jgi:CRISPR-associated protein (TIGR03986 family)
MAELFGGTLTFKGQGKDRRCFLSYTSRKGKPMSEPINPDKFTPSLRAAQEAEIKVEFELDSSGRPFRVRLLGEEWKEATSTTPAQFDQSSGTRAERGGRDDRSGPRRGERRFDRRQAYQSERGQSHRRPLGDFHNPYNFIPAPSRPKTGTDLDDAGTDNLPGHDRYHADRWSGKISVCLITQSPLLVPDAARARAYEPEPNHKIYPTRIDADGRPHLPPTSIKGMLRSAYEAVTNSRMALFEKHRDRLAYRMAAKVGPIPALIEKRADQLGLRLMEAKGVIGLAAKLCRYQDGRRLPRDKGEKDAALYYSDGNLPQHGDRVWVQVERSRCNQIERRTDDNRPAGNWQPGWVCVTGPNINRKRYERVFLEGENDRFIPITDRHKDLWRELIQNYQEIHRRDLEARKKKGNKPQDYLGDKPGETGWSRHIDENQKDAVTTRNGTGRVVEYEIKELHEGTLCYVEFAPNSNTEVAALIPVTISRRLFAVSPNVLLSDSLKPAQSYAQLSPADRVFGWVNQKGKGAYRGNLRIGPVRCLSPDPVQDFPYPGLPLAILGQPKPQQARFYVARSTNGEAQEDGISKEQAGYWPHKGLRGRKVYPHHAGLPQEHWDDPQQDRTQQSNQGFFQEYLRPHPPVIENGTAKLNQDRTGFELKMNEEDKRRDDQNRSITSWIKPNTEFEFEITVTNLSRVELGALLWLLELPEDHHHRLGGGKPLGFGSVRLTINWDETDLREGRTLQQVYTTLDEIANNDRKAAQPCINDFKNVVASSYGSGDFERAPFIAAFRRYAQGFDKPVHYPRALQHGQRRNSTVPPHPEGKAFEWFVANERTGRDGGPKLSLPDLATDEGLPILETR